MNCGCCTCLASAALPFHGDNRPGLPAIARRVGTHGSFFDSMVARLSAVDRDTGAATALAGLTTRERNDPSIAFLDAWATVGDVLTFYQERIANEGYLRTATERRSILELGRLVGYTLQPGVSASAYVAYAVDPDSTTKIARGSQVQSVPGPDEEPQMFETEEEIEARGAWNVLTPRLTSPQDITTDSVRMNDFVLWLDGTETALKTGDVLLFDFATAHIVAWVGEVTAAYVAKRTSITLQRVTVASTAAPASPGGRTRRGRSAPAPIAETEITTNPIDTTARATTATMEILPWIAEAETKPGVPPATKENLQTSFDDRFRKVSDFRLTALGALVPELAVIPIALANTPRPRASDLVAVYVLQTKTAAFGYNAPAVVANVTEDEGQNFVTFVPPAPDESEKENVLFLETADDAIRVGSFVVVVSGDHVMSRRVTDVTHLPRSAYGVSNRVARLVLDVNWWDAADTSFGTLRSTAVYARSRKLELAEAPITATIGAETTIVTNTDGTQTPTTVKGKTIELSGLVDGMRTGQWLIVSGERDDLPGVISAELAMVAQIEQPALATAVSSTSTILRLGGEGLAFPYKRETVKIYGNVVKVTHGHTRVAILGDGDATKRLQSFTLQHAPLTWVAAANPRGVVTTLHVRVHDVEWAERDMLAGAGPADRVFVTRTADDGKTSVIFGTGEQGARLPTGSSNVRAIYRSGLGRAGNVKAGQLTTAITRPVHLREVVNPIPASGGADPEPRDRARANVPLAVRALGRVVSVRDYEDFARTFAGIAKASAAKFPFGRYSVVHLTIAGDDEMEILESSDLFRSLVEALRKFGDPAQPLRVVNRTKKLMTGSARVRVLREYEWRSVAPRIRASLLETFAFERRRLGQAIFPGEVIAAIQRVPGVSYVDLDVLRGVTSADLLPGVATPDNAGVETIAAKLAKLDDDEILPAEVAYLPAALPDAFVLTEVPNV